MTTQPDDRVTPSRKTNTSATNSSPPVKLRLRREQGGRHNRLWGYRINALVFWILLFHTALIIPPVLSWTLLFLGYSPMLALLVAVCTIAICLGVSLTWARHSYRRGTRWTATLHRRGVDNTRSYRVVSSPHNRGAEPESFS